MKSSELEISKTKIDRAGELLKNKLSSDVEITQALNILSGWRAYHAMPLDTFATALRKKTQKITDYAVVAQRLKRTPSILRLPKYSSGLQAGKNSKPIFRDTA